MKFMMRHIWVWLLVSEKKTRFALVVILRVSAISVDAYYIADALLQFLPRDAMHSADYAV